MAGSAAMMENSATMRTCSRAPAILARQALQRPALRQAITAIMATISRTLMSSAASTISLRGTIGVSPVRMR